MLMTPQWRSGIQTLPVQRVLPPNPLYVDTVTGTALGTGSISSPVNSLAIAQALCAGLEDWVIKVMAPESNPLRQEITYESSMNLTIEGVSQVPWYIYGSDVVDNVWSGSGPVYSKTLNYTLLTQVVVTSVTEVIGDRTFKRKLLQNTETPLTPSQGEFGYSGGVLYVRMFDDSDPSTHTFEIARRNTCISTIGFGTLTIKDCVARHALVNCLHNGRFGQPLGTGNLVTVDCLTEYAVNGGVGAAGQNESTVCFSTKAFRVANDGFNLHALAGLGYMELNDCIGSYNGDKAGQSAQGASNHEATHMVINGGEYNYNVSGGMVVIETARCDIHGDTVYGSVLMDSNMRLGNTPGPVSLQASCAWMDTSFGTVTGDVTVSNGQGTGIKVNTPANVTGANLINSINNALPDIGV